jgi:tetratricopeptide (TPR) repeat protein
MTEPQAAPTGLKARHQGNRDTTGFRGKNGSVPIFRVLGSCVGLTLLLYLPTLWYGFVWDDGHLIVGNEFLGNTNPIEIFAKGFWYNPGQGEEAGDMSYYRPLANLSFFLERKEFELNPAGYHLTNIVLHAVNVGLLGMVVMELFGSVWLAGAAALLLGINPAQNCVACFVANRTYLLALLFLLVALYALVRGRHDRNRRWAPIMGAGFLLACLALETPLLFAPIALAWLILNRNQYRRLREWIAALVLPALVYLFLRLVVAKIPMMPSSLARWTALQPLRVLNTFGQQMLLFFVPFGQKVIYTVGPIFTGFSAYTIFGIGFLVVPLAWLGYRARIVTKAGPPWRALLGYVWAIVLLLPFSNLVFLGPSGRMLYLASPGVLIFLVALVRTAGFTAPGSRFASGWRLGVLVVVGIYGATLAGQLQRRNSVWRDELTLSGTMTREAPDSPGGHLNYGAALATAGQTDEAIEQYRRAIDADSEYVAPHNRLAFALIERNELEEASFHFREVVRLAPSADAYNNLALTLKRLGRLDSAIIEYHHALSYAPESDTTLNNLGRALMAKGDLESATRIFQRILSGNPDFTAARENLLEIYRVTGMPDSMTFR